MTNLEEMNSNPNPKPLSYLGAALVGFVLQAVVHLNLAGMVGAAFALLMGYAFFISVVNFYATKYDIKVLLHFNEFWFTLDEIVKQKFSQITSSARI